MRCSICDYETRLDPGVRRFFPDLKGVGVVCSECNTSIKDTLTGFLEDPDPVGVSPVVGPKRVARISEPVKPRPRKSENFVAKIFDLFPLRRSAHD